MTNEVSHFSGREWIEASHFHDLTPEAVLKEVFNRIEEVRSRDSLGHKHHPLVLLDLDSTLYEVGPRNLAIVKDWLKTQEANQFPGFKREVDQKLHLGKIGYSLRDTMKAHDIPIESKEFEQAIGALEKFWTGVFFTNQYLPTDRPYNGAPEFVQEVYKMGAEIVYLTGRDDPGMGEGTRKNLVRDGFPFNMDRTRLILKAHRKVPDLEHKVSAAEIVETSGKLVASFENEPVNLVAFYDRFPEAMHVFVETVWSPHPARPVKGLYKLFGLKGFVFK